MLVIRCSCASPASALGCKNPLQKYTWGVGGAKNVNVLLAIKANRQDLEPQLHEQATTCKQPITQERTRKAMGCAGSHTHNCKPCLQEFVSANSLLNRLLSAQHKFIRRNLLSPEKKDPGKANQHPKQWVGRC